MGYEGNDNEKSTVALCLFISASAMVSMLSSVSLYLNRLTAQSTKRALPCTYPRAGTILSMLGEKIDLCVFLPMAKGRPVSSQHPVHLASAHSYVRSNGKRNLSDRCCADLTSVCHG